jgi:hypothetical protein
MNKKYLSNILFVLLTFILTSKSFAINFNKYNSSLILLVTKQNNITYVCSSVAISSKKLLTAAHCLEDAKEVKVVKEYKLQTANSFYQVESFDHFIKYDKTKSNFLYDFGIVKLVETLPTNINLPKLESLKSEIGDLTRVGFGMRNEINSRTIIFPINQYRNLKTHIDAYDRYSFSGDSGGPIFLERNGNLFLVAIHSTKDGYNTLNPTFDVEVLDWINNY